MTVESDKMLSKLKDPGTERVLIATIIKYGKNAYIDADGIVGSNDFAVPINRSIYTCLGQLSDDVNCETYDLETIKMKAKTLGNIDLTNKKNLEYIELLSSCSANIENIPMFALQVKKFSTMRDIYDRYVNGIKFLENATGNEPLSEIIAKAEGDILDYVSGTTNGFSLNKIGEGLEAHIQHMIESESVDQVGIPTGFPLWDKAIGGGLRRGSLNMKGGRPKSSKSFDALNNARNIAKRGIPVLYLDSELVRTDQQSRLICMDSCCPLDLFENGKFKEDRNLRQSVLESAKYISTLPLHYESISGKSPTEILGLARRWLVKTVGFKENGHANDCVVILDYIKISDQSQISGYNPEHIAIGFLMTQIYNFAIKYNIPLLGYMQLNRDGIDNNDSSIVASSDRILWLCSSLSFIKNKDETDIAMGDPFVNGNKKIIVCETRHGAGFENQFDYINMIASLRPGVGSSEACGRITEGYMHSSVSTSNTITPPSKNKYDND